MKTQLNFHSRTGIKPGIGITWDRYGKAGTIIGMRLGWSMLTLTVYRHDGCK